MPRTASSNAELLEEAAYRSKAVKLYLANPSTSSLVEAQQQLDVVSELLQDSYEASEQWARAQGLYTRLADEWQRCCRRPHVRRQALRMLSPEIGGDSRNVLLGISCYARKAVGEVVLASLAAGFPNPAHTGSYRALGLPAWAEGRLLSSGLLEILQSSPGIVATRAEAEIAATLWSPQNPGSPYQKVEMAHSAAKALLLEHR